MFAEWIIRGINSSIRLKGWFIDAAYWIEKLRLRDCYVVCVRSHLEFWQRIHYSERSAKEMEAMPLSYNLMVSKFVHEFPNLLTFMPGILLGVSLRDKCISCCKRPCVLRRTWKGSGRAGECLYSLPAKPSFEMQQIGVTIIGTKFIETSKKEHWGMEVRWPVQIPASSEFQERVNQRPERDSLFSQTGGSPLPAWLLSKAWVSLCVRAHTIQPVCLWRQDKGKRLAEKEALARDPVPGG